MAISTQNNDAFLQQLGSVVSSHFTHNAVCFHFPSNAQSHLFAIAFKLLLKIARVLLGVVNGQVDAADFVVICEEHHNITKIVQ